MVKKQVSIRMNPRTHQKLKLLAAEFSIKYNRNIGIGEVIQGLVDFATEYGKIMDDEKFQKKFKAYFDTALLNSFDKGD